MTKCLTIEQTRDMFLFVGEEVIRNKGLLTEIDSAIGDGDHGIGMETGFTHANEQLKSKDFATVNDIFKTIGMTMISTMGGASGVIFGTMFAGGMKGVPPLQQLELQTLADIFEKSLQAVKERGKANVGDKTMIDALEPAVESLKRAVGHSAALPEALALAEIGAKQGVEESKKLEAKFGRAKSLGERAVGHQDAGATSVWIIFRSMRDWVQQHVS